MTRLKFFACYLPIRCTMCRKINIALAQKKPILYINKHKNNTIEVLDFKIKETIKNFRIIIYISSMVL